MSTIVVLYGLLLGAPRHDVIVKLTPLERERVIDKKEGGDRGMERGGGEDKRER